MFVINDDNSIYVNRGDALFFAVSMDDEGVPVKFQAGDVLKMNIHSKKDCSDVVFEKRFPVNETAEIFWIYLSGDDTKIDEVISKHKDYWYEVELNPDTNPQKIISYFEDGPVLFRLFPEGADLPEKEIKPEDIPVVDTELDMTSNRPVENRAVARAFENLHEGYKAVFDAVSAVNVTPQMFGAIGDGEADDTDAIQNALNTKAKVYIPSGTYKVTKPLNAFGSIEFSKDAWIEFYPNGAAQTCLKICGSLTRVAENITCSISGATMTADVTLNEGDYVYLSNSELASHNARSFDTKRDILQVQSVEDGVITFTSAPVYDYTTVTIDKMNLVENVILDGVKIKCMRKYSDTYGIKLVYARNATVKNCQVCEFDYGQINFEFCVLCDAHSNLCEVSYSDQLQYGIVVHSSLNVSVYGNKVNSRRTAIDVTRLSNNVTVNGNTVTGNINTHSCTNTSIANNTINDGMILIRGKKVIVTGNSVNCLENSCIDIEEMGIEGGHIIANNIFKGYCSMKCFLSNISIKDNHFIVEKVLSYQSNSMPFESVIRLMTAGTPNKTEGAIISGNTFEAVGIKPLYCVEANANMNTIYNLVVSDNVVKGFQTALYLPQITDTIGENLIVKNNLLYVTKKGIVFRLVNNTQIVGNTIIGTEKGEEGIARHNIASGDTVGLILRDNFVKNFTYGVRINGGADIKKTVYMDNIYQDCDTRSTGISGNTTRIDNELFVSSADGTVFILKVGNDGVLTPTSQGYKA